MRIRLWFKRVENVLGKVDNPGHNNWLELSCHVLLLHSFYWMSHKASGDADGCKNGILQRKAFC